MTSKELNLNEKIDVKVKTTPNSANYKNVLWESDDTNVVSVEKKDDLLSATLHAKKPGKATITVSTRGGYYCGTTVTDSWEITVKPNHLSSINPDVFWCQTGGWFADGSDKCSLTAIATMASINSDSKVEPTDVAIGCTLVKVNGIPYNRAGFYEEGASSNYNLNDFKNADKQKGFNYYTFNNESEILYAINYELNNGRAVVVKTNGGSSKVHWVTVTKIDDSKNGFKKLWGIDPWFNGTGDGSNDSSKSGIIQLTEGVQNQTDFLGYRIMTFNID